MCEFATNARRKIERIVHRPRRMIFGNIKRREVVEIVFDFRSVADTKAIASKEFNDPVQGSGHGVQPATGLAAARQCDVNRLRGQVAAHRLPLERVPAAVDPLRDECFQFIDCLTGRSPFLRRQLPQGLQSGRYEAALAKEADAQSIQSCEVRRSGNVL